MSKEHTLPLQFDMFSGELVDNRTRHQKKKAREREKPKQTEMFSSREVAQFGINPRPLIPLSPHTKLLLIPEDPRSEAQIEIDRQKAAEKQTYPLFSKCEPDTVTLALAIRGVVALTIISSLTDSTS